MMAKKKTRRKKKGMPDLSEAETKKVITDEVEDLRQKAAKADEYLDLAKRTKAEFLNYQDRMLRDQESIRKYAVEGFIRDFLPALDAVRESVKSAEGNADAASLVQGVQLIEKEFLRVLSRNGITPIEAVGRVFDPAFHEAIAVVEDGEAEPNTVLVEIRRGWMLRDRVLRPSMVQIAKSAENEANAGEEEAPEGQTEKGEGEAQEKD